MFTSVFAVTTVTADAPYAAVDHLDAAKHQLHHPHGQQDEEQDDVPHHCIVRVLADRPQSLVCNVADIASARERTTIRTVQDTQSAGGKKKRVMTGSKKNVSVRG